MKPEGPSIPPVYISKGKGKPEKVGTTYVPPGYRNPNTIPPNPVKRLKRIK